jgi:hypothetical protein
MLQNPEFSIQPSTHGFVFLNVEVERMRVSLFVWLVADGWC